MQAGDLILVYLSGVAAFVGALRVTGPGYWSEEPAIWGDEERFPARVPVEVPYVLEPTHAVDVRSLIPRLPRLRAAAESHPGSWGGFFRGAPRKWPLEEGATALDAIRRAAALAGRAD
jgi:hypothetical protein